MTDPARPAIGPLLRLTTAAVIVLTTAVSILFVAGSPGTPGWARLAGAGVWVMGAAWITRALGSPTSLLAILALSAAIHGGLRLIPATHQGNWAEDHARAPEVAFEGERFTVSHFRSFRYGADGSMTPSWKAAAFDLSQLEGCDYVVVPFAEESRLAHTMVSFRFENGRHLAISVEARREADEEYSVLRAFFRQFELLYVIGDEEDLLGGRLTARGDTLYVYPVAADREALRRFLIRLLEAADETTRRPRWYNSIRSNCTTSLVEVLEESRGSTIPWDLRILLPGGSAELVYDLGLLDPSRPYAELREEARIDPEKGSPPAGTTFSSWIRQRP